LLPELKGLLDYRTVRAIKKPNLLTPAAKIVGGSILGGAGYQLGKGLID